MRQIVFIFVLITVSLSCEKDTVKAGREVEIYLFETYQTLTSKCQIDPSNSVLQDVAVVKNKDILEYSRTDYQFKLADSVFQKVKMFRDGTPFAVTIDKQVIYYGFFKPSISSSSCDHSITMDVAWSSKNKIVLRLGYPGTFEGQNIDDQRNNPKLLATLRNQDKLR